MIDLWFILIVSVIGLIVGEIVFLSIRYFTLRRQGEYESKIDDLTSQLQRGKLSQLLFRRMERDLKEKYNTKFYEKWWGR